MLQKKPEGVGSGGRVKSYAPLWELGRGGFLNVSFPRISEFLLWRKPSLTFYFLSWCESVASGQVQQVSSRWGWFWGLRSPWLHAGMEVSVSWALQRLVNVDYTTFTRRQDVLSTFFFFLVIFDYVWLERGQSLFCPVFCQWKTAQEKGLSPYVWESRSEPRLVLTQKGLR